MAKATRIEYAPSIKQVNETLGGSISIVSFNEETNIDQVFEIVVEDADGALGYLHLIVDDDSTYWRWLTADPESSVVMKGSEHTLIEAARELGAAMESLFSDESEQ